MTNLKDINYMDEYHNTHVYGYAKEVDGRPVVLLNLFHVGSEGKSETIYIDKMGAAEIGKYLMEFAESPDINPIK